MKKNNKSSKKPLKLTVLSASVALAMASSTAFAAPAMPNDITPTSIGNIAAQSASLKAEIKNLAIAGIDYLGQVNYQKDKNLAATSKVNTATINAGTAGNVLPSKAASLIAQDATQTSIDSNLKQFVNAVNGDSNSTPTPLNQLTKNAPADDTLYLKTLPSGQILTLSQQKQVKKPTVLNNDYFNFASVIAPVSYTMPDPNNKKKPSQYAAAENFVKYTTQNTQSLMTGKLKVALGRFSGHPKALIELNNSPVYREYQLGIRTLLASRSMELDTFNHLIAERTPIPGLGAATGIKQALGLQSDQVSPLRVESYRANHRIDSKSWYKSVQKASPATLQRKTLIVLAEIEQQNYQAHLDRERLLAAITAVDMQLSAAQAEATKTTATTALMKLIDSLVPQTTN